MIRAYADFTQKRRKLNEAFVLVVSGFVLIWKPST
jgi:hypothetical protein